MIPTGEQSGWSATESVLLRARMKSGLLLWNWNLSFGLASIALD